MKHIARAFRAIQKSFPRFRPGLIAVSLVAVLICGTVAGSGHAYACSPAEPELSAPLLSTILGLLDEVVSLLLKISGIFFFVSTSCWLLADLKKMKPEPPQSGGQPAPKAPPEPEPPLESVPEQTRKNRPPREQSDGRDPAPPAPDYYLESVGDGDGTEGRQLTVKAADERGDGKVQKYFVLEDSNHAVNVLCGNAAGPIRLKESSSGPLVGTEESANVYIVRPGSTEIAEKSLRYTMAVCFTIDWNDVTGQKLRVRVDKPAKLYKADYDCFLVDTEGKLTVLSAVE